MLKISLTQWDHILSASHVLVCFLKSMYITLIIFLDKKNKA